MHARTFYLPLFPLRPFSPSALSKFSHKIKEGDWLQETVGAKSLHETFNLRFFHITCMDLRDDVFNGRLKYAYLNICVRDSRLFLLDFTSQSLYLRVGTWKHISLFYTPLTAIRLTGLHFIIVAAKYIRALQVCRESVVQLFRSDYFGLSSGHWLILTHGRTRKFISPPSYKGGGGGVDGTPPQSF